MALWWVTFAAKPQESLSEVTRKSCTVAAIAALSGLNLYRSKDRSCVVKSWTIRSSGKLSYFMSKKWPD